MLADHRHALVSPLRRRRAPADPEDSVRAGARPDGRCPRRGWNPASSKQAESFEELAAQIGVPAGCTCAKPRSVSTNWRARATTTISTGATAPTTTTTAIPTLPNPNLYPLGKPPYYAFQIILGDLGTSGGLRTDEFARVLRADGSVIAGLYAVGNASAAVMGRSYAGAGATIGPAMTFGYVAARHIAEHSKQRQPTSPSTTTDTRQATPRR